MTTIPSSPAPSSPAPSGPGGAHSSEETDGPRRTVSLRRVALAGILGFGFAMAVDLPSWQPVLAGFFLMMAICFVPRRSVRRMRASDEIRRRQSPLWPDAGTKAVVEAMLEPAFVIDRNLLLRFRNGVSERAFGNMTLGDAISLRFRSPELLAAIEASVADRKTGSADFVEGRSSDRFWSVDILPIPASQGERPSFFLLLFRDRTAERRIERMRTDFVANASHELRTPLASLIGFIETLQGAARDDAVARARFLDIMRDQAARMSRLIDDLLSLSRIEMKRHVAVEGRVDLAEILREVREALEPLAGESALSIEIEAEPGAHIVAGDRDELLQVFSNLVENACKYGEGGKRVVMTLKRTRGRDGAFVEASVSDFGAGIAAEHVPRLTERFYRVETAGSRARKGTGLGLSIVRNILVRHRARLLVHSVVGQGSTFTARFPVKDIH
ncbi:two-component sensor histidine kinase [Aureimonas sp. SA4125]|uniref:ATP-binding protein n=1 Tax=Aureimonas sp. SA4125 TaxID=2826993 RepID=UPI001CC603C6|nr:ATP-binding protein [Aureimonas sp. SA4125]BDA83556.1 two-component sensor histidine kinase [Aureimonas sp. SA4125]